MNHPLEGDVEIAKGGGRKERKRAKTKERKENRRERKDSWIERGGGAANKSKMERKKE